MVSGLLVAQYPVLVVIKVSLRLTRDQVDYLYVRSIANRQKFTLKLPSLVPMVAGWLYVMS